MAAASSAFPEGVSPLFELVFDKLSSLIHKGVGRILGADKEMKNLASTLLTILHVLEDAEEKQVTNTGFASLLLKLRDLAYDANDTLDRLETAARELQMRTEFKQVCFSYFSFPRLDSGGQVAKRLDHLGNAFDAVVSEMSDSGLRVESVEKRRLFEHHQNRETISPPTDAPVAVYGRDEERESVVRLLLNNVNSREAVSVLPIVGIGGLGKTILAQLCYNDQRVQAHFEVRIWICVSNGFDVKKLTTTVQNSVAGNMHDWEKMEMDPFLRDIFGRLAHKRFLLILDDVWSEEQEEWNKFKNSLSFGARGSSVIVTTRLNTVASITGTQAPCFLKFLSEHDCWSLFKQRAFGAGNDENPNLITIGHEIVRKCGGIPLAAKVLGGLLRFTHGEKDWSFVRDSTMWDLPQSDGSTVLAALRLSYNHLEPHLRQCLAFCSVFPKDFRMDEDILVRLWIANGFIQSKGERQLEDIGSEIFNELCWRSFFQDEIINTEGIIVSCMMHDLVHDFTCSISGNESYHLGTQRRDVDPGTRHLSLNCATESYAVAESIHQLAPDLRTLMFLDFGCQEEPLVEVFKSLRALSLKRAETLGPITTQLLNSVANLKHLRYLDISYSGVALLPNSLCELGNLQTLELKGCSRLQKLPKHMRNMSVLRHLNIEGCDGLSRMPIRMRKLIYLQTLSIFIVGKTKGWRIKELGGLDYLSGEIVIKGLGHVKTREEAKEANLIGKKNIISLKLVWDRRGSDLEKKKEEKKEASREGSWKRKQNVVSMKPDRPCCNLEGETEKNVLEGLQPHLNMKRLCIEGYTGLTFPTWLDVSNSLPNIVFVSLVRCTKCERLPSFGRLPLLRSLEILHVKSVKFFSQSDDAVVNEFCSLKDLTLKDLRELEDWFPVAGNFEYKIELEDWFPHTRNSQELNMFPHLKTLVIENCPQLKRLPPSSLSLLETLHVIDCNPIILESLQNLPRLSSLHICFNHTTDIRKPELMQLAYFYPALAKSAISNVTSLGKNSFTTGISDPESCIHQGSYQPASEFHGPPYPNLAKSAISKVNYQQLNSLRKLRITGTDDMTSLPDGLQHLSSTLEELFISRWSALNLLPDWIGNFTNLKSLHLEYCNNLRSLPDGLQQLTNLRLLNILACHHELHRRCKKNRGEDWLKIAHIPQVTNDYYGLGKKL